MRFKAIIDSIHFDSKKGTVKISLVATSQVSLDELTTIGPKEDPIQVTFECEQTKIGVFPLESGPIVLNEAAAAKLKEAAERLREDNADGDEVEGQGQGQGQGGLEM